MGAGGYNTMLVFGFVAYLSVSEPSVSKEGGRVCKGGGIQGAGLQSQSSGGEVISKPGRESGVGIQS